MYFNILALSWMSGLSTDSGTTERECKGYDMMSTRCLSPVNGDDTVWNQRPATQQPAVSNLNTEAHRTAAELYIRAEVTLHDLRLTLVIKKLPLEARP